MRTSSTGYVYPRAREQVTRHIWIRHNQMNEILGQIAYRIGKRTPGRRFATMVNVCSALNVPIWLSSGSASTEEGIPPLAIRAQTPKASNPLLICIGYPLWRRAGLWHRILDVPASWVVLVTDPSWVCGYDRHLSRLPLVAWIGRDRGVVEPVRVRVEFPGTGQVRARFWI